MKTVHIEFLSTELEASEPIITAAIAANGFFDKVEFDPQEMYLLRTYIEYLDALELVKESQEYFKYTDGEESVDKSKVYDQVRRTANDLLTIWRNAKTEYDAKSSGTKSFFTMRKRARFLDE